MILRSCDLKVIRKVCSSALGCEGNPSSGKMAVVILLNHT